MLPQLWRRFWSRCTFSGTGCGRCSESPGAIAPGWNRALTGFRTSRGLLLFRHLNPGLSPFEVGQRRVIVRPRNGVNDGFARAAQRGTGALDINLLSALGGVSQNPDVVVQHLDKPAVYGEGPPAPPNHIRQVANAKLAQQRGVARQDSHVTAL